MGKRKGKITRQRVKRALEFIGLQRVTDENHDKVIEDIVTVLAKEKYMSSYLADSILDDVKKIIPLISELKWL